MPEVASPLLAGRSCPPHYGYSPRVFARAADFRAETMYVIGGLYGNAFALDAIERLAAQEPAAPALVFNGDFHWFDAEPGLFAEIERRVIDTPGRIALRGNVETEIAGTDSSAGCGCAYPASVADDDVARSNAILERLRTVSAAAVERKLCSERTRAAGELPMFAVAAVGAARVAIVHGDAWSLAGWRFAHDGLHDRNNDSALSAAFAQAQVDGFACSHTCAPALKLVGGRFVINNGAAGMANFADSTFGVITRISVTPATAAVERSRLYGARVCRARAGPVFVDALRVDFDLAGWIARFDAAWPAGSPAATSYRRRIVTGPRFTIADALGEPPASATETAAAETPGRTRPGSAFACSLST